MTAVTCYAADFNLTPDLPVVDDLIVQGQPAGPCLSQASGSGQINLSVDWSRRDYFPNLIDPGGIRDGHLLDALSRLLGGTTGSNAGLLLTNLYAPSPGQYGMMFDLDGQLGSFGPRQGCAIFLSAIKLALADLGLDGDLAAFKNFVSYTAVHELGHVFNLWHLPASFMQAHPDPMNPGPCKFDPIHQQYLALAAAPDTANYVLPGPDCTSFGRRPAGWPVNTDHPFAGPPEESGPLSLRISLSHKSFWSFEPVELTMSLSVSGQQETGITIPDELDPGHASFQIWITRPNGERFRYRPQARFCRAHKKRRITPRQKFQRDISIFRQSGGYTFGAPGRYEVQMAFKFRADRFVCSNVVRVEVLPAEPSSPAWTRAHTLFRTPSIQALLRYKHRSPSPVSLTRAIRFADRQASPATASAIHYALGIALIRTSNPTSRSTSAVEKRNRAVRHLRTALQLKGLSKHRITTATTLIDSVEI